MLSLLTALTLAARLATVPADSTELRRDDLMTALRDGGYTILLRHARTDRSFTEEMGYVPTERYKQRNLNDDGVKDARLMGVVLKKFRIPIGEILSSPMFRATETAEYAAGAPTTTMLLRVFPTTDEQGALVAKPPKAGTNRLLVTHHFVIEKFVPGIRPGEIGESEAAIVRPTADGRVELVGRITREDWVAMGGSEPTSTDNRTAAAAAPTAHGTGAVTSAAHHGGGAGAVFPDTPAGRLAHEYLAAFNSGDSARMRAFIGSSLVADANRPTDARVASYLTLFATHGVLSITSVESTAADAVVVSGTSKVGSIRLTVQASPEDARRATSIRLEYQQGGQ